MKKAACSLVPVWSMQALTSCLVQSKCKSCLYLWTHKRKQHHTDQELTLHYDKNNKKNTVRCDKIVLTELRLWCWIFPEIVHMWLVCLKLSGNIMITIICRLGPTNQHTHTIMAKIRNTVNKKENNNYNKNCTSQIKLWISTVILF